MVPPRSQRWTKAAVELCLESVASGKAGQSPRRATSLWQAYVLCEWNGSVAWRLCLEIERWSRVCTHQCHLLTLAHVSVAWRLCLEIDHPGRAGDEHENLLV